ncbi:MAG: ISKra4 family transposase, partial [Bryobacterales bacterium]|nr:ISKra4 family transposase [Bryobacterales bacterium]
AQGLQIGSGVVEAGCKSVAGARLKQSGMRWTKDGAQGILALRACILGGRYEDFWAWRSESQHAAAA